MPIQNAFTPLRMIFWGGLLCVFDLTFSSTSSFNGRGATGFQFDILNDFVGMLLITIGVSRLSRFAIDQRYLSAIRFVYVICILCSIEVFLDHFIFPRPIPLVLILNLLGLASLVATIWFCVCMRRLSIAYGMQQSAQSWVTTQWLVVSIWAIPLGLLYIAGIIAMVTGDSFHFNVGLFIVPIILVMVVPLLHLFISTSRMRREASLHSGTAPNGIRN